MDTKELVIPTSLTKDHWISIALFSALLKENFPDFENFHFNSHCPSISNSFYYQKLHIKQLTHETH